MNFFKKTSSIIFFLIFVFITISFCGVVVVADEGDTAVGFNPSSFSVNTGDGFDIDVYCFPGQPIKAFEFTKLYFDASLLQVNSVTKGDIFDGYNTLFHPGTINNVAGSITNVYGLIIGQGNVSDNGSLITVSFTAVQNTGSSSLNLSGVGVTDEFGYISVAVFEGNVTVLGSGGENPPGGGDGYFPPPPPGGDDENNAPGTPLTPVGPSLVEIGVEYVFETSSFDVDGNMIRFRFDWGDGNFSNWSEYIDSNISISMSHFWAYVSSFEVRVIAQDESGLNSSWSLPFNVTVSQAVFGGSPPVANINVPSDIYANETIVFDASGSFDLDGFIVFYFWDFGDGENGSGLLTSHVYKAPGEYLVTLTVTDNEGNKYSTSLIVNIASDVEDSEEERSILPFSFNVVIIGISTAFLVCLIIFFRQNIRMFFSTRLYPFFSNTKIFGKKTKIKKIDDKIQKIRKSFE